MHWNYFDFNEILSRQDQSGIIHFMETQRVLMFDSVAHGLLRKELVQSLGLKTARAILTRFGYAQGWRMAEMLDQGKFSSLQKNFNGPYLHSLYGHLTPVAHEKPEGRDGEPLIRTTWQDSYEVEQHNIHLGASELPVCWTITGFASGFVSKWRKRPVYFLETYCQGKGDSFCRIEGRSKEDWGDRYADQLAYYDAESVDTIFTTLTEKLKNLERKLAEKEQKLSCLGRYDGYENDAKSRTMQATLDVAGRVAEGESSVVIYGETGVGKERVARFIHQNSRRCDKPFLAINCAAITESLLESEMFGSMKGSFSGATHDRVGFFEAVDGGTLFLDEVGEISPAMQVKILRVLQEREIRRVGESHSRSVDFRIVAATNRNLAEEVRRGTFRQDLYYRLRVIELKVPPLRERREDILPLARTFLDKSAIQRDRRMMAFTPQAADRLIQYSWPGNVRELENTIEYAVAMSDSSKIDLDDLPEELRMNNARTFSPDRIIPLDVMERQGILNALTMMNGNKTRAAKELNISVATLYRKLEKYSI